MMKVKDLQFAKYFLQTEVDLSPETVREMLNVSIEIKHIGEPDTVIDRGRSLVITNPSSISMFLFRVLYTLLSRKVISDIQKDKLGLGLLHSCRDYIYQDFDKRKTPGPPVIVNPGKLPVPSFIINDMIEPLTGNLDLRPVLFMPCNFTDVCRVVESIGDLENDYKLPKSMQGVSNFPIILCNCNVRNSPAQLAHLTIKLLEFSLGSEKTNRILTHILLDESMNVLQNLILIVKGLRGEADFIVNFLDYLGVHALGTEAERELAQDLQMKSMAKDKYLSQFLKLASPQANKQWSQWSMMMGLIEKQLEPMRGSMWPATENLKPHEDKLRTLLKEDASDKGKSQQSFDEMLEVARDLYNHNAVEPGSLIEVMLKDKRVWKE